MNNNVPKITDNEIANVKRSCIEHRAIWMGLFMDEMKKAGIDAEKIGRDAITRCGCFQSVVNFKDHMEDPMSMREFGELFVKEPVTFENEVVEISDDVVHIKMNYCPLLTGWRKIGLSEEDCALYCDIAMNGDRQFAKAMNAEFSLTKKIAEGDDCCDLKFTRIK